MNLSSPYYIEKRQGSPHFSLSGNWDFTYCDAPIAEPSNLEFDLSATLPASTYRNLNQAGVLPNPYYGVNSKEYTWADTKIWYYKKDFDFPDAIDAQKQDAFLCFDGVGYYTKLWLNGEFLGDHAGMFGGPICNIADKIKKGTNEIIIEVKAFNYDKNDDKHFWRGYIGSGWRNKITEIIPWNVARDEESSNGDFHVFGIWREVRIEVLPKTHIARPYLYTKSIDGNDAELSLELSIATDKINELDCILSAPDWDYNFSYFDGLSGTLSNYEVTINVEFTDPDTGKKIYSEAENYTLYDYEKNGINKKFRECQFYNREIKLKNISLWYPNGMGKQKLYNVEVSIGRGGLLLDKLAFNTGIRIIEQFESEGRKYRQRWNKYWFSVNGNRMFLKGMNWTPLDYLYNTAPKEYDWALEQAKNCGIQLLRVWSGGGMPEEDYFYDLCDRLGIMVWQDSFIANQTVLNWDERTLENQVCYNLFRIRNHPSLAVHCGGNEFSCYCAGNSAQMFVIKRNIEDLDPSRPFYRATPDGGSYHGYRNMDASWVRRLFKELPFMAETGSHSFPNYKSIKQNISENEWYKKVDITADDFEKEFPHLNNHLTEYKRNKCLIMRSRASHYIDLSNSDLKTLCEGTQISAYEYYQFAIQAFRENYPKTVGVMPWVFKRNWTTAAVQLVDGMGEPTATYYAVKNSYAPKLIFAALDYIVYAPNEDVIVPAKVINEQEKTLFAKAVIEVYDSKFNIVSTKEADISLDSKDYIKTAFIHNFKTLNSWADSHFYVRTMLYENNQLVSSTFYPLICLERMREKEFFEQYRSTPQENILFDNGPFIKNELAVAPSKIEAVVLNCQKQDERIHLKLKIKSFAPNFPVMVKVVDDDTLSYESDNYFFMGDNEEKTVDMEIWNKGERKRELTVSISSWNSEPSFIKV